ncbi:hypothetical protein ACF0H5_002813 [Mactra antiquata]
MDNQTDSQSPLGESLEDINNAHTKAYTPVIIFVILIIIVGLISNSLAFIFFSKKVIKSSFHYFISAISLNDALVNLTLIEDSVALFQYINNDNTILCKLYYFFIHWFVGNSLLLIVAISADRFRRVVYPFARQMTVKIARNAVVGTSLFSLSISVHYFYTCRIEHLEFLKGSNQTVVGYICALSEEYPQATVKKVFHITDICLHVTSIGFLIIAYIIIVRKLMSSRLNVRTNIDACAHRKKSQDGPSKMANVDDTIDEADVNPSSNEAKNQDRVNPSFKFEHASEWKPSDSNIAINRNDAPFGLSETERAFSLTAFVISVASVVSFVPYYVNMFNSEPNTDGKSLVYTVADMMSRRSYMLNSTVNPFIMLYFNSSFRKFVVNIWCCLCPKRRRL